MPVLWTWLISGWVVLLVVCGPDVSAGEGTVCGHRIHSSLTSFLNMVIKKAPGDMATTKFSYCSSTCGHIFVNYQLDTYSH